MAADFAAANAPGNCAAIYTDGLILYLSVTVETAARLTGCLTMMGKALEVSPSKDCLMWAWILLGADEETTRLLVWHCLGEMGKDIDIQMADNRQNDCHCINDFVRLIRAAG